MEFVRKKGERAAKEKWDSVQVAWTRNCDGYVGPFCYVVSHLARRRGWVKTLEDLQPQEAACDPVFYFDDVKPQSAGAAASSTGDSRAGAAQGAKPAATATAKPTLAKDKAAVRAEQKKCKNGLHFALKCQFDTHFVESARLLVLATGPECEEDIHYRSQVLTPAATQKYWADLAADSWLTPLVAILKNLQDLRALARCGFITNPETAATCSPTDPLVYMEDARSQQLQKLAYGILKHRASSCGYHGSYPGALARLVHDTPEEVERGMTAFKALLDALAWCEDSCDQARAMASRSMLKSKLMSWCGRQCQSTNFVSITALLRQFLESMWQGGPLNTIINENLNKYVRDQEIRAGTSKSSAVVSRYNNILFRGLPEHYGRKSPSERIGEQSFGNVNMDSLFSVPSKIESDLKLDRILRANEFQTWTPHTIKRSYGEQALMLAAHHARDKTMIPKAVWKTPTMPENQVIIIRPKQPEGAKPAPLKAYYTLWNSGPAMLAWRCTRDCKGDPHVHIDSKEKPEHIFVTDFKEVFVVPTQASSPLRCLIEQKNNPQLKSVGCVLKTTLKEPKTLLAWQTEQGFAHVDEETIGKVATDLQVKPLPNDCIAVGSCADRYVAQIALDAKPKMSPQELTELLHKKASCEDEAHDTEFLDQELLDEVFDQTERQNAMDRKRETEKVKNRFVARMYSIHKLVTALAPYVGKPRPHHRDHRDVKKAINKYQKKGRNIWAHWTNPDDAPIYELLPPGGKVYKDLVSQRYKVHHVGIPGSLKSFAWGRRGVPSAHALTLRQAWSWEQQLYGGECPLPQELLDLAV